MREFGVIGLGRMGGGLALQALAKGARVVGNDVHPPIDELTQAGLVYEHEIPAFIAQMSSPRVIFLYVHAGELVDQLVEQMAPHLAPGDIIVDGGNSYWGDSIRRTKKYAERNIHFVDLGTSGGLSGARNGACFMLGGHDDAKKEVAPILRELCVEGGFVDAGGPGSGHFTKLVHNGIEFGMLQAIGEGVDMLERFHEELPVADVLSCWRNGSVIRSWLVDLMHEAYVNDGGLQNVPAYVEDTGEVNWLVGDAMQMEVPIPVIAQSVMQLFASRDEDKNWARSIAMMRKGFGGHQYGPQDALKHERKTTRIGDIYRPEAE